MEELSTIEAVIFERIEQQTKHHRTVDFDQRHNYNGQLITAAIRLLAGGQQEVPDGWNADTWFHMISKSKKKRYIIASALIMAEIDRIEPPKRFH